MILIDGDANITEREASFIDFIMSNNFPWYYMQATENYKTMAHILMTPSHEEERGKENSHHTWAAEEIFDRICGENFIRADTIYRMAFNISFHEPTRHGDIHVDHHYPHYVMVIYLNDFEEGKTFLFDKKYKEIDSYQPKKNKFIVFEGCNHAQGYCAPNQSRLVLVVTFSGKVPERYRLK